MKKLITLCVLIMGSSLLSACQFFIDDRSEALMVVSVDEWAEATHKAALHDEAEQLDATGQADANAWFRDDKLYQQC